MVLMRLNLVAREAKMIKNEGKMYRAQDTGHGHVISISTELQMD